MSAIDAMGPQTLQPQPTTKNPEGRAFSRLVCLTLVGILGLFFYVRATREMALMSWIVCMAMRMPSMKEALMPPVGAPEEVWVSWRAAANKMTTLRSRLLKGEMAEIQDVSTKVKGRELPMRVYVPEGEVMAAGGRGVILFLHGGGWVMGDIESMEMMAKDLASATDMVLVAVDYQVAPEKRYPAPIKDVIAAIKWIQGNIAHYGGDRKRLAIVGESAGGNLAVAGSLVMGGKWYLPFSKSPLCALVAASPILSFRHYSQAAAQRNQTRMDSASSVVTPTAGSMEDASVREKVVSSYSRYWSGYLVSGEMMGAYWMTYLKSVKDGSSPLASPLRGSRRLLGGLPPTLLIHAEHEVLLDEIQEFGHKVNSAGVQVEEFQLPRTFHGTFAKPLAGGKQSLEETAWFLQRMC